MVSPQTGPGGDGSRQVTIGPVGELPAILIEGADLKKSRL